MIGGARAAHVLRGEVRALDCDFYVFTGHKTLGPTGIGVLYGKAEWLERMPPYQGGGDMIASVTFEKTTYNALPYKFEAGAPPHPRGLRPRGPLAPPGGLRPAPPCPPPPDPAPPRTPPPP